MIFILGICCVMLNSNTALVENVAALLNETVPFNVTLSSSLSSTSAVHLIPLAAKVTSCSERISIV